MRQTGTAKLFKDDKGFGFIIPDAGGADCFVHIKGVMGRQALVPGERVEYELEPGLKGPHAVRVAPLDREPSASSDEQRGEPAAAAVWRDPWQPSPVPPSEGEHRRRDRDARRHRDRSRRHWADE